MKRKTGMVLMALIVAMILAVAALNFDLGAKVESYQQTQQYQATAVEGGRLFEIQLTAMAADEE
jgi:hypothetical protein